MSMSINQPAHTPPQTQAGQPPNPSPLLAGSLQQLLAQGFTTEQITEGLRQMEQAQLLAEKTQLVSQLTGQLTEQANLSQQLNELDERTRTLQREQAEFDQFLASSNVALPDLTTGAIQPGQ